MGQMERGDFRPMPQMALVEIASAPTPDTMLEMVGERSAMFGKVLAIGKGIDPMELPVGSTVVFVEHMMALPVGHKVLMPIKFIEAVIENETPTTH